MILTSLYNLSPPPKELVEIREEKVKQLIQKMGEKYLLAKPIQRVTNDKRN